MPGKWQFHQAGESAGLTTTGQPKGSAGTMSPGYTVMLCGVRRPTARQAAVHLEQTEGNIFLTTGAKELAAFAGVDVQRLYVRVLPLRESLEACAAAGISGSHIVAMQGPFSQALNEALLRQFSIRFLVTKDGGAAGGFAEKAAAAAAAEAQLIVLRRPREEGADYNTVLRRCREVLECR